MVLQFDSLLNLLIFGKNMHVTFDGQCTMEALEKYLESTWKVLEILSNLAKYLSTSTSTIHKQKKYLSTSTSTHKIVLKYQST